MAGLVAKTGFHHGSASWTAVDIVKGNAGNDFIDTANRPAARDIVDCGAGGDDFASVDPKDEVRDNCERVDRFIPKPPPPGPIPID